MTLAHPSPAAPGRNRPGTARTGLSVSVEWVLNAVLFATILTSFLVFIEPAPYELMVALLGLVLLVAGLRIDRVFAPLILLLTLWAVFGAFSLLPVIGNTESLIYYIITVYMEACALIFAFALADNTERRLATLQRAYVVAAVLAACAGIAGYLNLVPSLTGLLTDNGRARATFKDPNVYGPFLILPLLWLIQDFIIRGFRLLPVGAGLIILLGIFFSFSRGAWGHLVLSAGVMVVLMFITSPDARFQRRLVLLTALAGGAIAGLLLLLLSFGSVAEMFEQRANLVNYYDTSAPTGRFGRQLEGLLAIFDYPNGVGPKYFGIIFGMDPHNVYLATLYAHGWVGGFAYIGTVVATLYVGFRGLLIPAPWQAALIAAYATFLGVAMEGFIIDTDHWRHFFLLLGTVWGLTAGSLRYRALSRLPAPAPRRAPA